MDYDCPDVPAMNILFIKLSAIGDVVQTLPALEALKNQYPDSHITWVVEDAARYSRRPSADQPSAHIPQETWLGCSESVTRAGLTGIIRSVRDCAAHSGISSIALFKRC
jgi:hypothetical protein